VHRLQFNNRSAHGRFGQIANRNDNAVETHCVASQDVVVVGMRQNPFPRRARKLLEQQAIPYRYLEYGSYVSQWRERLKLKLWTGWPTFPMIFVKGVLIGGFADLQRVVEARELGKLLAAPRS